GLSGGPWYTSASLPMPLSNGTDSGSGVASASGIVAHVSAPLSAGTCGTFSRTWTQVTLAGGADTTVASGNCYRYRYTISDNVGNQTAASANSADARMDTSGPAISTAAPTAVTAASAQYYNSPTGTLYFAPSSPGSFQLDASASDAQSGVTQVAFPNLGAYTGFTG